METQTKGGVITIDRTKPFDPVPLLGKGWSVIEYESDPRSTALTEIDLSEVRFESMLEKGEGQLLGAERLRRLQEWDYYIRLDARICQTLWKNQSFIPESYKEKITRGIYFDGTVLRSPNGYRCVPYLYYIKIENDPFRKDIYKLHGSTIWLGHVWGVTGFSAVIPR